MRAACIHTATGRRVSPEKPRVLSGPGSLVQESCEWGSWSPRRRALPRESGGWWPLLLAPERGGGAEGGAGSCCSPPWSSRGICARTAPAATPHLCLKGPAPSRSPSPGEQAGGPASRAPPLVWSDQTSSLPWFRARQDGGAGCGGPALLSVSLGGVTLGHWFLSEHFKFNVISTCFLGYITKKRPLGLGYVSLGGCIFVPLRDIWQYWELPGGGGWRGLLVPSEPGLELCQHPAMPGAAPPASSAQQRGARERLLLKALPDGLVFISSECVTSKG